ncbi:MAG TPA: F0F1 ATP synthase subunit delta [Nocardioides sp.]|uniref:F0F1 ATP synthase subunit delta n=1 Tax=Nocardioides sp. TaxID=35761 RepID=UPI002BC564C7|nr:F0F1 ATP synthase subunit delta [Nocardioides sp.]HQR25815.1 F0F1 ATP synthase subunit delta [Nocardioides sp.]
MTFRGASAEALRVLAGELEAALSAGGDAETTGHDLFAVASVLRGEPQLRRIATDVSVAASAKQRLVRGLLAGKVGDLTLGLVGDAVGRRWTATRDLADVLEHLGVVALVRSADADSQRLSDELFTVAELVRTHPELRDALADPARSVPDRRALLARLLDGKALPATVALAQQALSGSFRTVGAALESYQQVAAEVHRQKIATVRVAQPLGEGDRQRLTEALARKYDREIHLNVVVDPSVIGGIRVEIGDEVIDGTVASRLDDARRKLAG